MAKVKKGDRAETKGTYIKKNCIEAESRETNTKLSLPVISDEKLYNEDNYTWRIVQNSETEKNGPTFDIPKVKISCVALNYEKIIDFKNNKVTIRKTKKPKQLQDKKATDSIKKKESKFKECPKVIKNSLQKNVIKPVQGKSQSNSKKTLAAVKDPTRNKKCLTRISSLKENCQILIKNELQACETNTVSYKTTTCDMQNINLEQNSQASVHKSPGVSSSNLKTDTPNLEGSSFLILDDKTLAGLSDIHLKEFLPILNGMSAGSCEMKSGENVSGKNYLEDYTVTTSSRKSNDPRCKNDSNLDNSSKDVGDVHVISLQNAIETFINSPQVKYLKGSTALKRGLCFSWLSNNYVCSNKQCLYNHNALALFMKKLKKYPSKFIMTVVVSMRYDLLFVDVALAAFKVIIERQIPVVWVTFLTFFVFYVTEPSDSRFLKFWANVARFFCELQKCYSATIGFASIISVFSHIENAEKWKIIEFIKLLQKPPVQINVNFTLLQPVLKMDLPSEFLTEAIKASIDTDTDVLKVYWLIVPKISLMTTTVDVVELLLKLSQTLERMKRKDFAVDLRERLRPKVWSMKTKIPEQKYPLTAAFQEEISISSNEENNRKSMYHCKEDVGMDLSFLASENNYFQPEEDFCSLMAQALEFSTNTIPKPFRYADDVSLRQVNRLKQFFRDCKFDLLGKYLNEVRPNVTEQVAEEFVRLLFKMKISLRQGVDLIRIILLHCKSQSATKVITSISVTLILNLVRINEWEMAYTIMSLCQEKQINLVEGKVFYVSEADSVTQCRIALLLIEIYGFKGNYGISVELVKKYFLYSANSSLWQLTWKSSDETIRVKILEDLFQQIISKELTQEANDLFGMVWKEQKQLTGPVDLRKFVNEILILLLNKGSQEAVHLYEQIKAEGVLNDITIRSILVTLVRRNSLSAAKDLVLSAGQNSYFAPKITENLATVTVLSFWLEEEIYLVFDTFFDLLIENKSILKNCNNLEIQLKESKPHLTSTSGLRPLCLGIITPTLKDACSRIQKVLQYEFKPPIKLIIMPYYLKLDVFSVRLHLQKRIKNFN